MPYGKDISNKKRLYKQKAKEQVENGLITQIESEGIIQAFNKSLDIWDDCEEETTGIVDYDEDTDEVRPVK